MLNSENITKSTSYIVDPRQNWQRGFQAPATPIAEGIFSFHDDLRIFLVGILCFVVYILAVILQRFAFSEEAKTGVVHRLIHAPLIEIIWTVVPAIILIFIAIPSFSLLYSIDEIIEPVFTVKVVGHQWYWSYEFLDPEVIAQLYNNNDSEDTLSVADSIGVGADDIYSAEGSGSFDSYRLSEQELIAGEGLTAFRLLTVDNHLFLPTERHVRARITSADVLHSWAIPSLGVKLDACPGRLNQTSIFIKRPGVYYGQCSEICGVNHGFRPIGIVSQSFFGGNSTANIDFEPLISALQAIAFD